MCRERELLEALRYLLDNPGDTDSARELLGRIDHEEEVIRHERDPHGDDWHG